MERPEFHLERQMTDGSSELEIVPVVRLPWETELGRRSIFGSGVLMAAAVDALGAQTPSNVPDRPLDPCRLPATTVNAHSSAAKVLNIEPNDVRVVTQASSEIKLWSLRDLRLERTIPIDARQVFLSYDNRTLATISPSGALTLWSSITGKKIRDLATDVNGRASLSPDRTLLIVERSDRTTAFRLSDGEPTVNVSGLLLQNSMPLFTPDGTKLVTGREGMLQLTRWQSTGKTTEWKLPSKPSIVAFSQTGDFAATKGPESAVHMWNTDSGRLLHTLRTHWDWAPQKLVLTANGQWLLTGSNEGEVKLWSTSTGLIQWSMDLGDAIESVVLAMDDSRAVVRTRLRFGQFAAFLFSLPDGAVLAREENILDGPIVVPETGDCITVGATRAVKVIALDSGATRRTLSIGNPSTGVPSRTAPPPILRAFGNRILTQVGAEVWNLSEDPPSNLRDFGTDALRTAVFSPQNSLLFTASGGVVAVWDIEKPCFRSFLFDKAANRKDAKALSYNSYDKVTGRTITYTLPCGSPIPAGAVCTCNCVPGTISIPATRTYRSGGTYCSCNKICTCVPVRIRSSQRWKTDVRRLGNALELVEALRGVRFRWTEDAPDGQSGVDIGFIAEEVADVLPEVVYGDASGDPTAIDYARFTCLLVEAIKAQQAQIEHLQTEVNRMSKQIDDKMTSAPQNMMTPPL